jgi:methylmalonyl-CoA mutase cobalamin-binding subunit
MGFDRVYPPDVDLEIVVTDLRNDLKEKGKV